MVVASSLALSTILSHFQELIVLRLAKRSLKEGDQEGQKEAHSVRTSRWPTDSLPEWRLTLKLAL